MDTLQRELVLNLGQYETGAVQGYGWAATDHVTATGLNVIWPRCRSKRRCQSRFPIAIMVTDTSGAHLRLDGAFARHDTNTFVAEEIDESPGFPFAIPTQPARVTFSRVLIPSSSNRLPYH